MYFEPYILRNVLNIAHSRLANADEITKQLAEQGIPDSQSMALGEIGSNGRFINIGRERWQGAGEVAGRRVQGAGEVAGRRVQLWWLW